MSRLMIHGPNRVTDIAVPAHVPVADLLPALLSQAGADLADTGLEHGGWVLQRLGGPPLDEDLSPETLGLRDGESLYLRPRAEQTPPVGFDDLIDGVATGLAGRPGRWRPDMARWSALAAAGALLGIGLIGLSLPGRADLRAGAALLLCMAALLATAMLARAFGDRPGALLVSCGTILHAALAGLLAPELDGSVGLPLGAANVFTAAGFGLSATLLSALVVGGAGPVFAGVATAGALVTATGAGVTFAGLTVAAALGAVAVALSLLAPLVPTVAFRMAGMRLPPLPTLPEHLQEDIDPEPSAEVLARTRAADSYMTGLYFGIGIPALLAVVSLSRVDGWAGPTLTLLVGIVGLLGGRPMTSAWHRAALWTPGLVALVAAATAGLAHLPGTQRTVLITLAVPLLVSGALAAGRTLPLRRPSPYWGRAADMVQMLSTVAQIPVFLAVAGVYGIARAWGG